MLFVDVHDVGYGECIVFEGAKNEILMVDCGSMNTVLKHSDIKFKDYVVDFLIPRYRDAHKKNFLLSHFHKDHFCGLKYILKKEKNYFDSIFIPFPALSKDNRALTLEMAIYAFVFLKRQQACSVMSTSALFIFEFLWKNSCESKIIPLKRNDFFEFSGTNYRVLNPFEANFPFSQNFLDIVDNLDDLLANSLPAEFVNKFFYWRNLFCQEYLKCCELCRVCKSFSDERITQTIDKLNSCAVELNNLSRNLACPDVFDEIVAILNDENTRMEYSIAQNSSCIVFQNEPKNFSDCANILMTGDVSSEILNLLENDLFQGYNIIKVPHHGTKNYQSSLLNRLPCSHMLISNGEYHAGGKISVEYAQNSAIKHCTSHEICEYFSKNNSCCNRLLFCDSLGKNGALTSRCKKNSLSFTQNSCSIYLISGLNNNGCFCD